jgi:putative SOS response-associated peptidase YedK
MAVMRGEPGTGTSNLARAFPWVTGLVGQLMRPIHERMPVIVTADQYDLWLDPRCLDTEKLEKLLRPYPSQDMLAYRVSTLVNNPRNDMPQWVEALQSG